MGGVTIRLQRQKDLPLPAEQVWNWMCDPESLALFHINPFHLRAQKEHGRLQPGSQVQILHTLGFHREMRIATITKLHSYEIAWTEIKEGGKDWFPHHQKFCLRALNDRRCRLENHLGGTFHLPGARWWLWSWYRYLLPLILDWELRQIGKHFARNGEVP
ncbi:MAG: hypothetical protein DWQ01_19590 [Planctomycetota bacterium]|nr:MAG: hypothetical protein DWQ01_19590 [Planctomycetota bacterium]